MRKIALFTILVACIGIFFFINASNDEVVSNGNESKSKSKSESKSGIGSTLSNYEKAGEACKTVEEIVERGDCFQEVNEKYLNWYIDQSKREFYFPFQQEQEHWKDIFYYTVNEQDRLEVLNETEHFEEYVDPYAANSDSNHQRGIDIVQEYWYVFSSIIPRDYRESLQGVYWTDTGDDPVFAVGRDEENLEYTLLMLSHHVGGYQPFLRNTLIHEFAHVLTLNEEQVKIDEEAYFQADTEVWESAEKECSTHFVTYGWGCAEESSYVQSYYQQFWADIDGEFRQIDWEAEDDYKDFFFEHEERFFNSYQGTNPEEDIADAFTFFVMMNREEIEGNTEMKYDKLDFFYQYDELVELRTLILENIYDLSIEEGKFY